jgi:hypothetical protein
MKIGVVFPQTDLGGDVGAVPAYGEAAEALGYTRLSPTTTLLVPTPRSTPSWLIPTTSLRPFTNRS